jgi:hypothetical protein
VSFSFLHSFSEKCRRTAFYRENSTPGGAETVSNWPVWLTWDETNPLTESPPKLSVIYGLGCKNETNASTFSDEPERVISTRSYIFLRIRTTSRNAILHSSINKSFQNHYFLHMAFHE